MKLDEKEKHILAQLELDGRTQITKLAKVSGISKELALYKLRKLETSIIKGYTLLYNPENILLRVTINLNNLEKNTLKELTEDLKKHAEVNSFIEGELDIEAIFELSSLDQFTSYWKTIASKYGKFIEDKTLSIISSRVFCSRSYLHSKEFNFNFPKAMDLDEALIAILKQNPRIKVVDLAKKLGRPATTVANQIKKIIPQIRIVPILDVSILGFSAYKIIVKMSDSSLNKKLVSFLQSHKNIIFIAEILGEEDIIFDAEFSTNKELGNFLNLLRTDIPEIKDFRVFSKN